MGIVPVDFDTGDLPFDALATAAQRVFDERTGLCHVPIERVLELAVDIATIRPVATGGVMLSYTDSARPPSNPSLARIWAQANVQISLNRGMAALVALSLIRSQCGLTLTVCYPANDTARQSMVRYVEAFTRNIRKVADAYQPALMVRG
jgi:hypothetical protein